MRSYSKTATAQTPITTYQEELAAHRRGAEPVEVEIVPLGAPVDWKLVASTFGLIMATVVLSVTASLLGFGEVFPALPGRAEAKPTPAHTLILKPVESSPAPDVTPPMAPANYNEAASPEASTSASDSATPSASASTTPENSVEPTADATTPAPTTTAPVAPSAAPTNTASASATPQSTAPVTTPEPTTPSESGTPDLAPSDATVTP